MNNREDYLKDLETINAQIMAVEKEIADLDTKRATLKEKIKLLQQLKHSIAGFKVQPTQRIDAKVTNESSEKGKIILFRSLFRGREDVLPPSLKNRLIRLAAFQNPEFYKTQAMRFPTFDKPRIIHCCEDFPKHIGLPIGCLEDVLEALNSFQIKTKIRDERFRGKTLDVKFAAGAEKGD